jgi:hypothetical protein
MHQIGPSCQGPPAAVDEPVLASSDDFGVVATDAERWD